MAKIDLTHVPYKGCAPALADGLSGQVPLIFNTVPNVMPHARAGRLRALAVTSGRRFPLEPELPTVAEAGVPGYVAATWTGVIAPAGVPRPIVNTLNAAINKALKSEAFLDKFSKFGDEPGGGTPEEFAATIKTDSAKWADVVKRSGAKLD